MAVAAKRAPTGSAPFRWASIVALGALAGLTAVHAGAEPVAWIPWLATSLAAAALWFRPIAIVTSLGGREAMVAASGSVTVMCVLLAVPLLWASPFAGAAAAVLGLFIAIALGWGSVALARASASSNPQGDAAAVAIMASMALPAGIAILCGP